MRGGLGWVCVSQDMIRLRRRKKTYLDDGSAARKHRGWSALECARPRSQNDLGNSSILGGARRYELVSDEKERRCSSARRYRQEVKTTHQPLI